MVEEVNHELTEMKNFQVGDVIRGTVTKVEDKVAYVDVGHKVEAILPISELSCLHVEKASDVVSVGDELELQVKKVKDDEVVVSKQAVTEQKAWQRLKEVFANNETLEVEIAEVVKGGLVVNVGVRGFIPASLVEDHFVEDFSDYKGKTFKVKIVELDEENKKLVLSRRAVLDEEREKKKKEIFASVQPGEIIEGKVQRVTDFGAFVDVRGVDGLVHISQIAHERVENPADVLKEGEIVKVKVLSVDPEKERISLSIKETLPGPWDQVEEQFKIGNVVTGIVKRLVSFGAFVELLPGVEGLVHISQIANRHIATPSEVLKAGDEVKIKILDLNAKEKRISLSIKEAENDNRKERDFYKYQEEHTGFSLGDMIGDQLKKLK